MGVEVSIFYLKDCFFLGFHFFFSKKKICIFYYCFYLITYLVLFLVKLSPFLSCCCYCCCCSFCVISFVFLAADYLFLSYSLIFLFLFLLGAVRLLLPFSPFGSLRFFVVVRFHWGPLWFIPPTFFFFFDGGDSYKPRATVMVPAAILREGGRMIRERCTGWKLSWRDTRRIFFSNYYFFVFFFALVFSSCSSRRQESKNGRRGGMEGVRRGRVEVVILHFFFFVLLLSPPFHFSISPPKANDRIRDEQVKKKKAKVEDDAFFSRRGLDSS